MKFEEHYNNHWLAQVMRCIEGPNADFDLLYHYTEQYTEPEDVIFARFRVDHDERDLTRFYCDKLTPGLIAGAIDVWLNVIPTSDAQRDKARFKESVAAHSERSELSIEGFRNMLRHVYNDMKDEDQHQGIGFQQFAHEWARSIAEENFLGDTKTAIAFLASQHARDGLSNSLSGSNISARIRGIAREYLLHCALSDWPK